MSLLSGVVLVLALPPALLGFVLSFVTHDARYGAIGLAVCLFFGLCGLLAGIVGAIQDRRVRVKKLGPQS